MKLTLCTYPSPLLDCWETFSWPKQEICRGDPDGSAAFFLATQIWHLHTEQSFTGQVLSILACSPCVSPWRLHLQQTSINLGVICSFHSPKGPDSSQVNEHTNSFFWVSHKSTHCHTGIQRKEPGKLTRLTDNALPNYELCSLQDGAY